MIEFSKSESSFLESLEECRIATSHNDIPHVKPVSYVFMKDSIFIATDYDTRTYKNIKENPRSAITVDVYKHGGHKAVLIQGNAEVIDNGERFERIFKVFYDKFEWVRKYPWKENEAPFLRIVPRHKTSWGLQKS